MYQPHIDTFNVFITQYLAEIFDTNQEVSIFMNNEEHTIFVDNFRLMAPTESQNKTGIVLRILPDQSNLRNIHYNFNLVVDIVYKIYKCSIPFPSNEMSDEEKSKFEKEWLKLRDLHKKKIGRDKYYASYAPEDSRIGEVYQNCSLGPISAAIGSLLCHLQGPLLQPGEGLFDPFGVFCVGGTFRLISPLKDLSINQDFVDTDSKSTSLEVWSSSEQKLHYSTHTIFMYYDKKVDKNGRCKRDISIQLPFSKCTLAITTIFWSLGWTPAEMLVAVRMAARKQWKELYYEILNVIIQNCKCKSQEEAFLEIAEVEQKNLSDPKPYLIGSAKLKITQQLLPRLGQSELANNAKARYLGYMIWRILLQGEQVKPNDPSKMEERVTLGCSSFQVPKWMRVERNGEVRIKRKHRDHLANCRSDYHGVLLASLFRQVFGINWKQVKSHLQATLSAGKPVFLQKFFRNNKKLASRIQYCITTGRWSSAKDKDCRKNVSQAFAMTSHIAQESHYTYHSTAMNSDGKNTAPRQINESQFFNLCPAETPETKKCGLTGHSSQVQEFCIGSPGVELEKTLKFYQEELAFLPDFRWIELYRDQGYEAFDRYTQIFLNGKPIGYTLFPEQFVRFFWRLRRTLTIDPYVSICYDPIFDSLQIRTERGRVTVPFLIFPRLHRIFAQLPEAYRTAVCPPNYIAAMSGVSFHSPAFVGPRALLGISRLYNPVPEDPELGREREVMRAVLPWTVLHSLNIYHLMGQGLVDFLDPAERKMTAIALQEQDFWERFNRGQLVFTHIALDPHFMFSVTTGLTPFANHNQSPRNTYQAAMAKANVDLPFNLNVQLKTKHELFYAQAPFLHTLSNAYRNGYLSNSNIEPIGGLLPYFGFTVEDAQNMLKPFIRRGAGLMATTKLYKVEHKRKKSSSTREAFGRPNPHDCVGLKYADYSKITEEGVPVVGTKVQQADVIIGQTSHFRHPLMQGLSNSNKVTALKKKRRCNSIVYNCEEEGTVSSVVLGTNLDGTQFCRVQVRLTRYFEKGDKSTTWSAQKGTQSYFISAEDIPEIADGSGVQLEYLCNPQALPKRMTCSMLVEQAFTLAVARGHMRFSDATAFRSQINNLSDLQTVLNQYGMSFKGSRVRDGRTGREIQCLIFLGPLRFAKLKHIARDKSHVRANGPVNFLTRQAVEGRARGGGLRCGEMERSCLSAQNAAMLLYQQMNTLADPFKVPICVDCGIFAIRHKFEKTSYCQVCKGRNTCEVQTCYAFKLLSQELLSMLIFPKMNVVRTEKEKSHLFTCVDESELYR